MHLYEQLYTATDLTKSSLELLHDIVDDSLNDFRENAKWQFSLPTDTLNITLGGPTMNYLHSKSYAGWCGLRGMQISFQYLKSAENVLRIWSMQFDGRYVLQTLCWTFCWWSNSPGEVASNKCMCPTNFGTSSPPNSSTDAIQKKIILTGEFAESPYFKRAFEDRIGGLDKVILDDHPTWVAHAEHWSLTSSMFEYRSKAAAMGALHLMVEDGTTIAIRRRRPGVFITQSSEGSRESSLTTGSHSCSWVNGWWLHTAGVLPLVQPSKYFAMQPCPVAFYNLYW